MHRPFGSSTRPFARLSRRLGGTLLLVLAVLMGCGGNESAPEPAGADFALAAAPDSMTIDRILRTDARFSTLVAALDSASLDSTLASEGPFTLFAPPDSAFDALPAGTVPALLTEQQDQLRRILVHHVIPAEVALDALSDRSTLITLAEDTLQVRVTDSTTTVGATRILSEDVQGANGRILVIDGVLRPPPEDGPVDGG